MLHSLQHPCIVPLVGISIHPLCFALQLAPLGSLNTVLEEKRKGPSRFLHPFTSLLKLVLKLVSMFSPGRSRVHAPWSHANL